MNIARFSVKNAFLVNIITVFILIVGFVSLVQIQREAFPNVNFDIVNITTLFPGASPQEVEKLVTIPLEKEIREVDGIDEMTSVSVEGVSIITLELDPNARNTDRILNDISQATNRVEDLPFEAEVPIVEEVTTQNSPIIQIAMSGPFTELQLQQHAKRLEDRFLDLPGVASITRRGWRDKEIWVEAYPEKLKEQHIAIDEIVDALRTKNVSVSGGTLKSKKEEFLIRTVGEFETPEEIEEVVIRANDLGNWVKIKDVARVRAEFEDAKQLFRANGYPAIGLVVIKKAAFDVIDMVESVRREIAVFQNTAPPQLKMTEIDDISFYVKRRLSVLLRGGSIGFVLVLLVLALFMNPVAALMTALGIPFALCFVLICMPSMGITLNLLSMFGLIMMLGLLVDDAIVVSENVLRYTEQGEKPKHAAVRGTTEVIPAILTTVGTTMAAFFPLLFLPGIIGKFIRVIPIVVLIALIASLFEAFIVLPSHLGEFMEEKWRAWLERFHLDRWSHSVLNSLKNKYERAVRLILSHRFKVVSAFFILLIAIVIYAKVGMKFILFPARGIEEFTIQVEAPIGTSIEQLQQYLQPLEEEIQKLPEEELEDFVIQLGIKGFDTGDDPYVERGTHLAMGIVYLTPDKSRKREAQEIMNELKEKTKNLSGFSSIKYEKVRSGPPVGKPVSIRVRGDDIDVLKRIAGKIKEQLGTVDGVQGIEDSYEGGKKEIRVNIDEQKAAQTFLTVNQIARTVRAAFDGEVATTIQKSDEEIDVRVRFPEQDRSMIETFNSIDVMNSLGNLVPLNQVATLKTTDGLTNIKRFDYKRMVNITAEIDEEKTSSRRVNNFIKKQFENFEEEKEGYSIVYGGEQEDTEESLTGMITALVIAFCLIFFILSLNFKSITLPFIILLAPLYGFIGVVLAFELRGMPMSFLGFMGVIGLVGVVVNDSVVLIDFTMSLRKQGMALKEAAVQAGILRLRPILLTGTTTFFGLMPLSIDWGGSDPFLIPMALSLSSGILTAQFFVLLLTPCFYTLHEEGIDWLKKKWAELLPERPEAEKLTHD